MPVNTVTKIKKTPSEARLSVRVTPGLKRTLVKQAREAGVTLAEWIRLCMRFQAADPENVRAFLTEIAADVAVLRDRCLPAKGRRDRARPGRPRVGRPAPSAPARKSAEHGVSHAKLRVSRD